MATTEPEKPKSLKETVDWACGEIIISIGAGTFRDTVNNLFKQ